MVSLPERIRRARSLSKISQLALANAAGVQRSAVAQWERRDGSHPSMHHLVAIAVATGVCLEWLGTGRGPVKPDKDAWSDTIRPDQFAEDDMEVECLASLRKIPYHVRKQVVGMITLVSRNF